MSEKVLCKWCEKAVPKDEIITLIPPCNALKGVRDLKSYCSWQCLYKAVSRIDWDKEKG